jgi:DNA invertase Pin-like site-specific DNA recombinase
MRAALYIRVSTRDRGQDTANQLREIRELCGAQGWKIIHEYEDYDSGGKADRVGFKAMMADAAQRKFDVLLVWALDRMTREGVAETFEYIKRLTTHGVQFVSFTEEHFRTTGPAGELMIAVAAWIAKQERMRISERVRAGLDRAKANGTRTGRPIGRPRVVFRRDQVMQLRAQGESWRHIAKQLGASITSIRRAWQGADASV